jgi:Tfp pilus assembly protein PilW
VKRTRSSRGLTIVELTVSSALLVGVLAGANAMVSTSSGLARSTSDEGTAGQRADRALQLVTTAIRRGSLATLNHVDGTAFDSGQSDTGFRIQADVGYNGAAILGTVATYRFDLPAGATEGSILQTQDGLTRVLVNGVTAFTVTRTGTLLTLDVRARSGPTDDRTRTVHAVVQATTRNP